jgi:hypothetical protein
MLYRENSLVSFVFSRLSQSSITEELEIEIRNKIKAKLPAYYEPRKVLLVGSESIPLTRNGFVCAFTFTKPFAIFDLVNLAFSKRQIKCKQINSNDG